MDSSPFEVVVAPIGTVEKLSLWLSGYGRRKVCLDVFLRLRRLLGRCGNSGTQRGFGGNRCFVWWLAADLRS